MGLITSQKQSRELFKPYDQETKEALAKRYTPEQIRAIEAGEQAIDPQDLNERGVIRTDWGSLPYLDDFSVIRPSIDRKPRSEAPVDPNMRLMTEKEMVDEMRKYDMKIMKEHPTAPDFNFEDEASRSTVRPNRIDMFRAIDETPEFIGSNGPVVSESALAPGVRMDFEAAMDDSESSKEKDAEEDERDPDGVFDRLRKQTGLTLDQIRSYQVKVLVRHRVVNQTRLGKIQSQYCLAIAGNGNGRLGLGEAKGQEPEDTQVNARIQAIKNMQPIPRYEERTIFGEVEGKVSAAEVTLMARPPGFGLRCQHLIFEMARAAGIQDLSAKVPRSRNKMNTVKATYQALMKQRIPDEVARGMGKKLVDVRKVYYGGRV
ncbi:Ribosomal protein S5 2-like protein [Venustampulla echinocandica]|uniref:Small ribosomal subunit protein uS5m n=1 Tax=Venustampulla echinocandica TaxID=2656787 RepID=A0A370TNW3_9HELO|nr:Ribosomal protein S5 2-like protein [Venustampulla echinocandica]RDL37210.1 Ribosomal protein S5 2-like protein [Venustampulla echinocandica]